MNYNFLYENEKVSSVRIFLNGFVELMTPIHTFRVSVFNSDLNNQGNGSITYQRILDSTKIPQNFTEQIAAQHSAYNFIPTHAFIVTWKNLTHQLSYIPETIDFQLIIVSNEILTFFIFNYGNVTLPTPNYPNYVWFEIAILGLNSKKNFYYYKKDYFNETIFSRENFSIDKFDSSSRMIFLVNRNFFYFFF